MKQRLIKLTAVLLLLALLLTITLAAEPGPSESGSPTEEPVATEETGEETSEFPETGGETSESPETGEETSEPPESGEETSESSETGDQASANSELARKIIRVGLYYGSSAMDGANIANAVGAGFQFGYYTSDNSFVPLASYTGSATISVVKTENVYYGTYDGYTSYYDHLTNSSVGVGCYHLQLDGVYDDYETAQAVAAQYDGGFVSYIGGYYVRIGNYLTRDDAVAAQESLAVSGVDTTLAGTSSYGVSVVLTGTNTILFQYDDKGSGTGLGIEPIPSREGEKCVSYFNVSYRQSNRWYGGFRYERVNGGDLTVVNMVQLDDYAKGVVPHEMSDSWPLEALKAQAVAARSYALSLLNRHRSYHFDICPTTHCQAYSGLSRAGSNSDAAVDQTSGMVATYDGKYASCFYYSSNGGASESSSVVWGGSQSKYPYLIGVVDPFEELVTIPGYSWTRQYTAAQLTSALNSAGYPCSTIVSAKVDAYTPTGNPQAVKFTDSKGRVYTLYAYAMVTTFGLRSYRYDFANGDSSQIIINDGTGVDSLSGLYAIDGNGDVVPIPGDAYVITDSGVSQVETGGGTVTGDVFTITGKGWGHNVGMSQYGAYSMAKQGYTYDQILKFYYTGITVG